MGRGRARAWAASEVRVSVTGGQAEGALSLHSLLREGLKEIMVTYGVA